MRRLTAIVAAACFAAMAIPCAAHADSYLTQQCHSQAVDESAFAEQFQLGRIGDAEWPEKQCPTGIRFLGSTPALFEGKSLAWLETYSESTVRSVSFKVFGGDADGPWSYTLRECQDFCDSIIELPAGRTSANPATITLDLSDRALTGFAIQAECLEAICDPGTAFYVRDFETEFEDDALPDVTVTPAVEGAFDESRTVWVRGEQLKFDFLAWDLGSGVSSSFYSLAGNVNALKFWDCDGRHYRAMMCPPSGEYSGAVDISGIEDGLQDLYLEVMDGAHESSSTVLKLPFNLDNTPPGEPQDLAFSGNVGASGWTSDPSLQVTYADPSLDPLNTTGSRWKDAQFDLKSLDGASGPLPVVSEDIAFGHTFTIPSEGRWEAGVRFHDRAGNHGDRAHRFVGFDTDRPEPPQPVENGWINYDQLHTPYMQEWQAPAPDAELESGICGYAFAVDAERLGIPEPQINVQSPALSASIPPGLTSGKYFAHVRSVACNGKASATATTPVNVDGAPPNVSLYGLAGREAWLNAPPTLTVEASDLHSGPAATGYAFDDGSPEVTAGASASVIVPQGEHQLHYWALDAAGNQSDPKEQAIRADWTAPSARFEPIDPRQPNVITAVVSDEHSGVTQAGMKIRRVDPGASQGEAGWRALGESSFFEEDAKVVNLTRALPDGALANGTYEVRAFAVDAAGNQAGDQVDPLSPPLMLTLPLRGRPLLTVAIASLRSNCGSCSLQDQVIWSGASAERVRRYGERSALVGSLVDQAGEPRAGVRLELTERPEFGQPRRLAPAVTDERGEFVVRLPRGASRSFIVGFAGDSRLQPIEQVATLRVRAAVTLSVKPRTVRQGKPFRFSGKLLSESTGLPEGNKVVTIEWLRGRKWIPLANPRVRSGGRFSTPFPGVSASTRTKVYFRATAYRDGSWPFLTGSSKAVAVHIRP